jgi:hypothetical protein
MATDGCQSSAIVRQPGPGITAASPRSTGFSTSTDAPRGAVVLVGHTGSGAIFAIMASNSQSYSYSPQSATSSSSSSSPNASASGDAAQQQQQQPEQVHVHRAPPPAAPDPTEK